MSTRTMEILQDLHHDTQPVRLRCSCQGCRLLSTPLGSFIFGRRLLLPVTGSWAGILEAEPPRCPCQCYTDIGRKKERDGGWW
ncbi:hypothetical protein B296_00039206 [Ensete ventricosum]|uniref:Uncharacterized protein n=1 Tax=Ensete ventricosum TaxID=4639 RepID=A0A426YKC4_ENSVE|nr:hypothetical protein B296_00039206 [Ensete ventricosum]